MSSAKYLNGQREIDPDRNRGPPPESFQKFVKKYPEVVSNAL